MAQFKATIKRLVAGRFKDVSRLGHKRNGITTVLNGWGDGIRVNAEHVDGKDVFTVFHTQGSNDHTTGRMVLRVEDGVARPWPTEWSS